MTVLVTALYDALKMQSLTRMFDILAAVLIPSLERYSSCYCCLTHRGQCRDNGRLTTACVIFVSFRLPKD